MSSEAIPMPAGSEENESFVVNFGKEDTAEERLRIAGATTDPVKDYLKKIGAVPLINAEMEVDLAKRIESGLLAEKIVVARQKVQEGQKLSETEQERFNRWRGKVATEHLEWLAEDGRRSKKHMMEANLRLVVSLAKRYTGHGMPFLDLIQEGNLGLNRAVEKFDYTKGYKFSTYATWWIRQSITRAMADQARTIRVPVHMVENLNKMARIKRTMLSDLGREPTLEELAREMDEPVEKVIEYQKYGREPISLDTPLGDGAGVGRGGKESRFGDLIEDTNAVSPVEAANFSEMRSALQGVLDTLSEREAGVVEMRFGLTDGRPRTLDEIGKVYGVTRERIRQIESKAMTKLRHPSRSNSLKGYLE